MFAERNTQKIYKGSIYLQFLKKGWQPQRIYGKFILLVLTFFV